jgi:hypothetical protein
MLSVGTNPIFVNHAGSGNSIVVASVGRQVLPATDTETAPSLLWFSTIQCIESKKDLAGLAPKDCCIAAKPIYDLKDARGNL